MRDGLHHVLALQQRPGHVLLCQPQRVRGGGCRPAPAGAVLAAGARRRVAEQLGVRQQSLCQRRRVREALQDAVHEACVAQVLQTSALQRTANIRALEARHVSKLTAPRQGAATLACERGKCPRGVMEAGGGSLRHATVLTALYTRDHRSATSLGLNSSASRSFWPRVATGMLSFDALASVVCRGGAWANMYYTGLVTTPGLGSFCVVVGAERRISRQSLLPSSGVGAHLWLGAQDDDVDPLRHSDDIRALCGDELDAFELKRRLRCMQVLQHSLHAAAAPTPSRPCRPTDSPERLPDGRGPNVRLALIEDSSEISLITQT